MPYLIIAFLYDFQLGSYLKDKRDSSKIEDCFQNPFFVCLCILATSFESKWVLRIFAVEVSRALLFNTPSALFIE